ncbi:unnamed protein product [Moneuplotes crassus]|uniref:Uncharacterized protein n=1 Tax=Euplotes crassus TaxID=5936 RepID=A0AAD1XUI5_EUPCR|nr:unnamed protein product [Moneuplotes crassus]
MAEILSLLKQAYLLVHFCDRILSCQKADNYIFLPSTGYSGCSESEKDANFEFSDVLRNNQLIFKSHRIYNSFKFSPHKTAPTEFLQNFYYSNTQYSQSNSLMNHRPNNP